MSFKILWSILDYFRVSGTPNPTLYQFEPSSGLYYDPSTGLYYDSNSQYYWDANAQKWNCWNAMYQTYIPCDVMSKHPAVSQGRLMRLFDLIFEGSSRLYSSKFRFLIRNRSWLVYFHDRMLTEMRNNGDQNEDNKKSEVVKEEPKKEVVFDFHFEESILKKQESFCSFLYGLFAAPKDCKGHCSGDGTMGQEAEQSTVSG